MNLNRRNFLRGSTLFGAGLGTEALASRTTPTQHERHQTQMPTGVVPVQTPDIPKLPWTMEGRWSSTG